VPLTYLQRRLMTKAAVKPQGGHREPGVARGHSPSRKICGRFVCVGQTRGGGGDCGGGQLPLRLEAREGEQAPSSPARPSAHKKAANGPRVLSFPRAPITSRFSGRGSLISKTQSWRSSRPTSEATATACIARPTTATPS